MDFGTQVLVSLLCLRAGSDAATPLMYRNRNGFGGFGFASSIVVKPATVHSWHTLRTVSAGSDFAFEGVMATVLVSVNHHIRILCRKPACWNHEEMNKVTRENARFNIPDARISTSQLPFHVLWVCSIVFYNYTLQF
jgi:hypothetical protein